MLYMVTFTIDIPQMLAYIPYMDPMGYIYIYLIYHAPLQFVGYSKHLPGLTRQLMAWCLCPDVR